MTTPTTQDLREYLVGAWTLESYESSDVDGSNVRYPLGTDARGIIMYTADGYMSAQLMRADRPPIARADLQLATGDELAAAARGYLAYAGPYSVLDDGVIAHHVDVSLLPNWIGGTQYRAAQVGDDRLQLGPAEPVLIKGKLRNGRLIWQRAKSPRSQEN
ncbi:lipocalin-like domain-containing protein [Mycobacterium colombiense]|uniref:lipocalin-like domain-containing protein n=1 Tax=Mycobacterium colombiense TaxID=339268 RepID=UPI00200A79B0|nr:lipocalin-like domain-containing protein [Mycobacterium colombiense]MCK8644126.1 lipocalin-like domain-containing protein [Mycobacterium colombiense]